MIQFERLDGTNTTTPSTARPDALANKEVFLQLLVAQIQNQDPLNPSDSIQFLSQLSQFTQVEQTLGMRDDLKRILEAIQTLKPAGS